MGKEPESKNSEAETVVVRSGTVESRVAVRNGAILLPKEFQVVPRNRRKRADRIAAVPVSNAVSVKVIHEGAAYAPSAIAQRVVATLGNNTVAALIGVNKDRPSRWASGEDKPSLENQLALVDLDALVGHLLTVFTPAQALLWLEGQNPHLGARPLDVYRLEGSGPVIEAMKAHEQGAFA